MLYKWCQKRNIARFTSTPTPWQIIQDASYFLSKLLSNSDSDNNVQGSMSDCKKISFAWKSFSCTSYFQANNQKLLHLMSFLLICLSSYLFTYLSIPFLFISSLYVKKTKVNAIHIWYLPKIAVQFAWCQQSDLQTFAENK